MMSYLYKLQHFISQKDQEDHFSDPNNFSKSRDIKQRESDD